MIDNSLEIHVIGIDASGLEELSYSLKNLVLSAKRIAAPSRILKIIPDWWLKQTTDLATPELISTDKTANLLNCFDQKDKKTILLASGDPLWFGIGRLLIEKFPAERLFFHPSPTSFQLAFARLGRPWQDASWVSLHGRDPIELATRLQQRPNSLIILTDPQRGGAKEVQKFLQSSGLAKSYTFWLFEQLGHPDERITKVLPNEEIPNDLNSLNLVVLIQNKIPLSKKDKLPLFGIEDGIYMQYEDRPGLMTKREVRIQLLSDLELPKEGVLWDICAGVGSIGLEALRIRPKLKLLSLDKRIGCKELINKNASLLEVKPRAIYESDALKVIGSGNLPSSLLTPDRVLLGGGGENRCKILVKILEQISSEGIIVIPLSTLQAISDVEELLKTRNCLYSITQIQSFRGLPLGSGTRLAPMNPVFIIKAKLK